MKKSNSTFFTLIAALSLIFSSCNFSNNSNGSKSKESTQHSVSYSNDGTSKVITSTSKDGYSVTSTYSTSNESIEISSQYPISSSSQSSSSQYISSSSSDSSSSKSSPWGHGGDSSSSSSDFSSSHSNPWIHSSESSSSSSLPSEPEILLDYQKIDDDYYILTINLSSKGTLNKKLPAIDYIDQIKEVYFGDNIEKITYAGLSQMTLKKIHFSSNLKEVSNSFHFRGANDFAGFYFSGDCPEIKCFFNDDAWPVYYSYLFYNPNTKGWDDFSIQGNVVVPNNFVPQSLDMYSINDWCQMVVEEHNRINERKHQGMVDNNENPLFLIPTISNVDEFQEIKEFALSLVEGLETDEQKIDAIFDWVSNNIVYSQSGQLFSSYAAFKQKRGVCAQYTELMRDMLAGVGIVSSSVRCIARFGSEITSLERALKYGDFNANNAHKLVSVYLNDTTYYYDPTWHEKYKTDYTSVANNYLFISIDDIAIIPQSVSPLTFTTGFLGSENYMAWVGDNLFCFTYGRIGRQNTASFMGNFAFENTFHFNTGYDGEKYGLPAGAAVVGNFNNKTYSLSYLAYCRSDGLSANFMKLYSIFNDQKDYLVSLLELHNITKHKIAGDIIYDNTGIIELYDGKDASLTIPASINGDKINAIQMFAFSDNNYLEEVAIEEGIKYIADQAFYNCPNLKKITIPSTVVGSFDNQVTNYYRVAEEEEHVPAEWSYVIARHCLSLEQYIIAENNNILMSKNGAIYSKDGKMLFSAPAKCSALDLNGVEYLTHYACEHCSMESITFPSSIKLLGQGSFSACPKLRSISFVQEKLRIDPCAGSSIFANCPVLSSVSLPAKQEIIASSMFRECNNLYEIILPETIKKIGSWAFLNSGLAHINLPAGLEEIGETPFYGCFNLYDIDNYSSFNLTIGSEEYGWVAKYAKDISTTSYTINTDNFVFYSKDDNHILMSYVGDVIGDSITLPNDINGHKYKVNPYFFDEGAVYGSHSSAGSNSVAMYDLYTPLHQVDTIYMPSGIDYSQLLLPNSPERKVTVVIID